MIYTILDVLAKRDHDLSSLPPVLIRGAPLSRLRLEKAIEEAGPIFQVGYVKMEMACCGTIFTQKQIKEAIESVKRRRLQSCRHSLDAKSSVTLGMFLAARLGELQFGGKEGTSKENGTVTTVRL